MLALIYVSRANPGRQGVEALFKAILSVARDKNKALGITGLLAYADGYFVQLLEGDRANVLKVYASIVRDQRHTDITILSSTRITERSHNEWAMGAALLSNRSVDMVRQLQQIRDAATNSPQGMANDYFRHLLTPKRIAAADEEAAFMRPMRHIAICATSLLWLNIFFAHLRDTLAVKIESLIASDPTSSNPNFPVDYCDVEHPKFGTLRITGFYSEMLNSPLASPLLHRTEYLLALFARGATEVKLNFAKQLFQHDAILENKPQAVLVIQDDDKTLNSIVTQFIHKAKLLPPTFLSADADAENCWKHVLHWLEANPVPSLVTGMKLDLDVTVAMPITAMIEPPVVAAVIAPQKAVAKIVTPAGAVTAASPVLFVPVAAATVAVAVPVAKVKTMVVNADLPKAPAPPSESHKIEPVFAAIADLPGFRFAAIADTKSGLTTGVRAAQAIPAAEQLAFTKAVTLIQEWLSLGSGEIYTNATKTIDTLIVSQEKLCRIGYALGANSTLALVFELEREQTNIALTQMLLEDLKTELQRD